MDELLAAVRHDLYAHEEMCESDGEVETATTSAVAAVVVPSAPVEEVVVAASTSTSSPPCPAAPLPPPPPLRSRRMSSSARSSASVEARTSQEDDNNVVPMDTSEATEDDKTDESMEKEPSPVAPRRSVRAKEAAKQQQERRRKAQNAPPPPVKIERRGRKPGYRPARKGSAATQSTSSSTITTYHRAARTVSTETAAATLAKENEIAKKMRGIAAKRAALRAAAREVYDSFRMGDRRVAPMKRNASRRTHAFKRIVPKKSPAVGPYHRLRQRTTMYNVGDIVSCRDEENGELHFAQIRALLSDAYARNFAELVWLVPTANTLVIDTFDPLRFIHMDVDARWHPLDSLNFVQTRPVYADYWKEWTPAEAIERKAQDERRNFILGLLAAIEPVGDDEDDDDELEEEIKHEIDDCQPSTSGTSGTSQLNDFHAHYNSVPKSEPTTPMELDSPEDTTCVPSTSTASIPLTNGNHVTAPPPPSTAPTILTSTKTTGVPRIKPLLVPIAKTFNSVPPSTSSLPNGGKSTATAIPRLTNAPLPKSQKPVAPQLNNNCKPVLTSFSRPAPMVFSPIARRASDSGPHTTTTKTEAKRPLQDPPPTEDQKKIIEVAEANAHDVAKKDKEWVLELMRRVETEVQQEPKKEPKKRNRRRKADVEAIRLKEEDEERTQGDFSLGIASGRIQVPAELLVYPPFEELEERENGDPRSQQT